MIPQLELTAAQGVISLAVIQTLQMYREAAPKLADLRHAPIGDFTAKQLLLDAELYGGIAVVLIGGLASALTRTFMPLLLAASGLLLVDFYYRSVLNSPNPAAVLGETKENEE